MVFDTAGGVAHEGDPETCVAWLAATDRASPIASSAVPDPTGAAASRCLPRPRPVIPAGATFLPIAGFQQERFFWCTKLRLPRQFLAVQAI
ncbi:hypothetical protein Acor_36250 [Acrocarpospora corrugata]|uniref:Uncharacterized protein n=1 Tax=Acrocarpospora corrugata TaxID=35763 RepID=A0A5M3W345_9ACTN|nr:hypothetical protein Acor_36250 [Acrocarpospora corrugata]